MMGTTLRRLLRRGAQAKITKLLDRVRPEDVAVMMRDFTPAEQSSVFDLLVGSYPESATEVLTELDPQQRLALLEELGADRTARLLETAAVDDAVYLLDSLSSEFREEVVEIVDIQGRMQQVQERLSYREESAGRVMDNEFVALEESTRVGDAIRRMREIARDVEMISYLYIVDTSGHLLGVTPLRQLLLADPDTTLGEMMNTSLVKANIDTDQEEVAELAARYDLLAIPVTDEENKLVGIVTVDDILDIFQEEATEDIYKMAGTSDDELVYQDRSFKVAGIRLPWILFALLGLLAAGKLVEAIELNFHLTVLVMFIPVVMGMAGNIGSQTSTIAVRGLATGQLQLGASGRRFVWQQSKVGAVLAVICAAVVAAVAYFMAGDLRVALAVSTALFCSVQLASINGAVIPLLFKRLGIDPAIASAPLVTTSNDILANLVYFALASVFLSQVSG